MTREKMTRGEVLLKQLRELESKIETLGPMVRDDYKQMSYQVVIRCDLYTDTKDAHYQGCRLEIYGDEQVKKFKSYLAAHLEDLKEHQEILKSQFEEL